MTESIPTPPEGLGDAGQALWAAVLGPFELDAHEVPLLEQAVHVADVCADLQKLVERDGPMVAGRANPALVELRAERLLLSRLIVALRIPLGDAQSSSKHTVAARPQRRSLRGVYSIKGGVA